MATKRASPIILESLDDSDSDQPASATGQSQYHTFNMQHVIPKEHTGDTSNEPWVPPTISVNDIPWPPTKRLRNDSPPSAPASVPVPKTVIQGKIAGRLMIEIPSPYLPLDEQLRQVKMWYELAVRSNNRNLELLKDERTRREQLQLQLRGEALKNESLRKNTTQRATEYNALQFERAQLLEECHVLRSEKTQLLEQCHHHDQIVKMLQQQLQDSQSREKQGNDVYEHQIKNLQQKVEELKKVCMYM